jgi:Holliday junction resolvase
MKDKYNLSGIKPQKTKSRTNSRQKGAGFERKIAKILNETFNTKEFSRTPGSGAYATTHSLPEHLKIYGDLITPKDFKFCIEAKKGYNKESLDSLFNNKSNLWSFINQTIRDAEKAKKEPLLIIQQDRQQILALTNKNIFPNNLYNIEINTQEKTYSIYLFKDLLALSNSYWFI